PESILKAQQQIHVTVTELNDVDERINLLQSMQPGPGPHADIVRISKKRSKRLVVDSADVDDKIEDLEKMLT
ncbi:hypothetical protein ABI063_14930, partial [Enterococcus faecium]|uniref:hypothetical protein n=1 Tax=Enterococcus faecium TaxID=1352 RepID=UPI003F435E3B